MKKLITLALLLLSSTAAYATGGACPTGANYLNPATGQLVTLASLGVTSCYFASKQSGCADTNNGTSESTPWCHAPGMVGCTAGNCFTFDNNSGNQGTFPAGTAMLLRGGDLWTSNGGDLAWTWRSAGTSGSPIYLGSDPAWYAGASWTRPVLDLNNAGSGTNGLGAAFLTGGGNQAPYVIFDNFELVHNYTCITGGSGESGPAELNSAFDKFTRNYIHAWTHCPTANVPDGCELLGIDESSGQTGYMVEYNVWDGSDSTNGGDSCYAIYEGGSDSTTTIAYNYILKTANGIVGQYPIVHDNVVSTIVRDYAQTNGYGSYHGNGFENNHCQSPCFIYNNVISGVDPNAGVTFWDSPNGSYDWIFNNVIVNTTNGNVMDTLTGTGAQAGGGFVQVFNNTVECGQDSAPPANQCSGDSNSASAASYFLNNHFVTSYTPLPPLSWWGTQSNNVTQTKSVANGQGYTLAGAGGFAFSPTSGGSTIGAGANEQAKCTTIAALNAAAGLACKSDTTYGVSYNATNHTVVSPGRTPVARPLSAAWDSSAYQYSGSTPVAALPTFSPAGGVIAAQTVTASTSTSGCGPYIYFDTSNPPVTNQTTLSVTVSETVYAYVHNCPAHTDSSVSSAAYTVNTTPQTITCVNCVFNGTITVSH